ncbi:MAG: hypothetical protein M3220_03400 [Chloroflexota bacterium]|nr:hypothetical protein [Chloroflexota bacterium]
MDRQTRQLILAILGVVLVVVLCVSVVWLSSQFISSDTLEDVTAAIRDLLIIILAIESIFVGAFLLLMIWQLYQLIRLLREEIIPLLHTTQETVEHVKHTTTFVGQSVSAPIISVAGMVAGVKEMVDTLRGKKEPYELVRRERYDE